MPIIKGLLLISLSLVIYWKEISLVFNNAYYNEYLNYILLIPFILVFILFWMRKKILLSFSINSINNNSFNDYFRDFIGLMFCLLAYILKIYSATLFNSLEYQMVSFPVFVFGLFLILFNYETIKVLLTAFIFLFFLIPPPILVIQSIGMQLSIISAQFSYIILKTLGFDINFISQYGSPVLSIIKSNGSNMIFALDIACSGIYSMMGFIVFSLLVSIITIGSAIKKTIITIIGFFIFYALNVIRLVLLVIIGYYYDMGFALDAFHASGGLFFIAIGTVIFLLVAQKIFRIEFFTSQIIKCEHKGGDSNYCIKCGKVEKIDSYSLSKNDFLKFIALTVIVLIGSTLQIPTFVITKSNPDLLIKTSLIENSTIKALPEIQGYSLSFIYRDKQFEKVSSQDLSVMYAYSPSNNSLPIWVGFEIASSQGNLHPWEVCLISYPLQSGLEPVVKQLDLRDVQLLNNPPLTARYFVYKPVTMNITKVVLYWYSESVYKTDSGYQKKWSMTSVIGYVSDSNNYESMEDTILPIAKTVAEYQQPINTWSWLALIIWENSLSLILIIGGIILVGVIFWVYTGYSRKMSIKKMLSRITDLEEIQIFESIRSLKPYTADGSNIQKRYEEISGRSIDIERLHQKLLEAQKMGLVMQALDRDVTEPHILWKANY